MPQINQTFVQKVYELTAFAYANNIDCPTLAMLNEWTIGQSTGNTMPAAAITGTRQSAGAIGSAGNFDAAVLAAVQSSPSGVGLDDLRPILDIYKRPANQIGAALGRLTRQNKIIKGTDELWHYRAPKVDKTIGQRRNRKRASSATPASAGAANQQQAATG